jgi:glyoxylase-like metal-dependent hydrolase (beta-lactamase superfamily II)
VEPGELHRVSEHVWFLTPDDRTDRPALAIVAGRRRSLLLEVGASPAHVRLFRDAIAALDLPAPVAAVLTHWHWDHSFGGSALDVPIIAHRESHAGVAVQAALDWSDEALDARVEDGTEIAFCRDHLKLELPDRRDLTIVVPHLLFETSLEVDLGGGVTCHVEHVGGDHAADSSVVHVPGDGVLFLGDALYQRLYAPVEHLTSRLLDPLVARIAAFDTEVAIPGHHPEPLDRATFAAYLAMLARGSRAVVERGEAALDGVEDEEERETVGFLLAGVGLERASGLESV